MIFALDSANRRIYLIWWIRVLGVKEGLFFLRKQKEAKTFKRFVRSTRKLARFVVQKIGIKGCSSATRLRKESSEISGEGVAESKSFGKLKLIR